MSLWSARRWIRGCSSSPDRLRETTRARSYLPRGGPRRRATSPLRKDDSSSTTLNHGQTACSDDVLRVLWEGREFLDDIFPRFTLAVRRRFDAENYLWELWGRLSISQRLNGGRRQTVKRIIEFLQATTPPPKNKPPTQTAMNGAL